jgi:outer membrane protein TolC
MLKRLFASFQALLLTATCNPLQAPAALAQPHRIGGMQAPQLQRQPLAGHLQRKLDALRQKLSNRASRTSLQEAVEQSLLYNPTLAQSYSQIQEQQWNLIAVRRRWYPQLQASSPGTNLLGYRGSTSKNVNNNEPGFQPGTAFTNQVQTGSTMQLSWTFFDPSRGPSINAASESLTAQQLLFDVSARDLVLETQLAYFALQEQQQLIVDYELILNSTTQQVARTEALFNAGSASISDVEQIRTQQLQNLSTLIDTYRQLVDAAARLAQAMALPTGTLVLPQDQLALVGRWTLAEAETLQQAERLREEIRASLAQASSAGWRATALFNTYWPSFATQATGSFLNTNSADGSPGSAVTLNRQGAQWNGAVGLGFTWSIFDGGINAAQAEESKALARQFVDKAAVQRLSVAREVEQAYANYEASALALASSKEQLRSAQTAVEAVRERFNIGYSDMTSVVQTYNQSILAASAYARSIREFNTAVASLYRYSARWPDGALPLVQKRVQALK